MIATENKRPSVRTAVSRR